jgi:membrane fusion protein, multidrug efflux system
MQSCIHPNELYAMNDANRSPAPPATRGLPGARTDSSRAPLGQLFTGRRILAISATVIGLSLVAWVLTPRGGETPARQGRNGGTGAMPVGAATAETGDMPIQFEGLGTVTSLATVTVQSQISGYISAIKFKEGQMVKRGDPLIEIDVRPYQVALEQAEGALARDEALLNNARIDLKRYETLFQQDSIAEQQLATQRATVLQDEGTIKTDKAAVDAAKLNLVYCHITSPVDGLAGLQQINLGNYVTPNTPNGLVVVTQLQPITVVFPIPEDQVQSVLNPLHDGHPLPAKAYDRSHQTLLGTGTMATVDSEIDSTTGTLKLKANFPNKDLRLFPNQFVNVDLLLDTLRGTVLVPQAAILRGAPGTYVYVIGPDSKVHVRTVGLGPGDADHAAVTSGLTAGEVVVVDGADRLKDGAAVLVRRPGGSAAPAKAPGEPAHGKHGHRSAQDSARDPAP